MAYNNFEQLKNECLMCEKCELYKSRNNVVFGVGNENSEVLFIGEAPGDNEDKQGQPFVGRSGKLLDEFLNEVCLDRNKNIFIANILKCRPPENRDPKPSEQKLCEQWLNEQIELMKPKIIVCLGRIAAMKMISPTFKVTQQHGQFFEKDGVLFMGTFHPAAILRNINQKPLAQGDFAALRNKINEVCVRT